MDQLENTVDRSNQFLVAERSRNQISAVLILTQRNYNILLHCYADKSLMAFMGTAPFGSLLAGSLAKTIGVSYTILTGGIFCILGAFIFAKRLPELRKAVRPIYAKLGFIPDVLSPGIQEVTTETNDPPEYK